MTTYKKFSKKQIIVASLLATTMLAAPFAAATAKSISDAPVRVERAAAMVDFSSVIKAVRPAVVSIFVEKSATSGSDMDGPQIPEFGKDSPFGQFFDRFKGNRMPGPSAKQKGLGSGFLVSADGYVVTNDHVVGEADKITVKLSDGKELPAKLVGTDPKTDLALLKVEGSDFVYVAFGDSDQTEIGQWVVTVGSPFGLGGTANAGIISARGRDIGSGPYDDFLQIDAQINKGNSGGPAFNLAGEVIGVNSAIYSPSGGNVGIGFAIPANLAASVIEDLKDDGVVERGWLGVNIQPMTEDLASALGRKDHDGALVAAVMENTPAQKAGLKAGDLIVNINGKKIKSIRDLTREVAAAGPDKKVSFKVIRDGAEINKSVTLGKMAGTKVAALSDSETPTGPKIGLSLSDFENKAIIRAVTPGSKAAEKGVRPGDAIIAVAGKKTSSSAEVVAAINAAQKRGDKTLLMWLENQQGKRFVAFDLEHA